MTSVADQAASLEASLLLTEQRCELVADALLQSDVAVLEAAAGQLREAAAMLAQALRPLMVAGRLSPALEGLLGARIGRVSEQLSMHRANMARCAVTVDRRLAVVLPTGHPLDTATYDAPSARPAGLSGPARIYDARVA